MSGQAKRTKQIPSYFYMLLFTTAGASLSLLLAPIRNTPLLLLALAAVPLFLFAVVPALRNLLRDFLQLRRSLTAWHWLFLLLVLSGLTFRLRDVTDINSLPVDDWALFRIVLECVVAGFLLLRLADGRFRWLAALQIEPAKALALFVLFCAGSTLWSVQPAWTLYKSVEYGIGICVAVGLIGLPASGRDATAAFNWMWTLVGLAVLVVWMGALVKPADAFSYGEQGLFPVPELSGVWPLQAANSVGDLGALLSVVAFARMLTPVRHSKGRQFYWLVLAVGMVTMYMAQCRSAIAGFFAASFVVLLLTRRALIGIAIGGVSVAGSAITGISGPIWNYLLRSQQQDQLSSLSGRLDWWSSAWSRIVERPLLGWGGFAGGRFLVIADTSGSLSADIHSTFVETLLDTGLFGLLLLSLVLASTVWILLRASRNPGIHQKDRWQAIECLAVFTLLFLRAFFSTTLVGHSYSTFTFLLIVGYAVQIRFLMRPARGVLPVSQ